MIPTSRRLPKFPPRPHHHHCSFLRRFDWHHHPAIVLFVKTGVDARERRPKSDYPPLIVRPQSNRESDCRPIKCARLRVDQSAAIQNTPCVARQNTAERCCCCCCCLPPPTQAETRVIRTREWVVSKYCSRPQFRVHHPRHNLVAWLGNIRRWIIRIVGQPPRPIRRS